MSQKKLEEQMILRLPPQVAEQVRKMLRTKQLTEEIEFEFEEDQRNAKFRVGRKKYDAYVVDLPCVVESHKTLDKTSYYKSADIGQMLVVQDPKDPQPPPPDFNSPNGVTTATRDIQRRKWRKPPDPARLKEIENEVNRLLKPAENESIEILNADDFEDLDELNGVVEKFEHSMRPSETKIKFKMPAEEASPEPAAEAKDKKKKPRRKKEKKEEGEGEGVAHAAEVKPKKEKRSRRKKKDEGAEGAAAPEGQTEGSTEKKKPVKRRERKPKAKGAASEPALPNSPPITTTTSSAPPFPFSNTITPLPPPMAIPSAFAPQPIGNKVSTPAAFRDPFANATSAAFTSPITTTPLTAQHAIHPIPSQPLVSIVSAQQENMGYQQLLAQQKKLQQEVEQFKLKVTDATNKYNILPNAILKQRQQGKLQEVTEQHAQKVKELEMVEQQLKDAKR